MADREKRSWWDMPVTIGIALGVVLLITTFVAKPFSIPSGSMEDTLQVGDRILVNRMVYHTRPAVTGDVVVFDGSGVFVPESNIPDRNPIVAALVWVGQSFGLIPPDTTDFVKRVIGVGGDRVTCCAPDGRLLVNGEPISEPYIYPGDAPSLQPFDVEVPPGMLWVMGDHRSASADSRAHLGSPGGGFVPEEKVVGRAMTVLWPPRRIQSIPLPSYETVS